MFEDTGCAYTVLRHRLHWHASSCAPVFTLHRHDLNAKPAFSQHLCDAQLLLPAWRQVVFCTVTEACNVRLQSSIIADIFWFMGRTHSHTHSCIDKRDLTWADYDGCCFH